MKQKYFYVIGDKLQFYKIKAEAMEKCFEFAISPLAIKFQRDNNSLTELLTILKEEILKESEAK